MYFLLIKIGDGKMNIDIELPDYDGNALDIIWEKNQIIP